MIPLDVLAKKAALVAVGDEVEFQGKAIGKGSYQGRFRFAAVVQRYVPWAPRGSGLKIWQRREPSTFLQLLEKEETLVVFQSTTGTAPVQEFTDCFGKFGQAERRKIVDEVSDEAKFRFADRATTKRYSSWHGRSKLLN